MLIKKCNQKEMASRLGRAVAMSALLLPSELAHANRLTERMTASETVHASPHERTIISQAQDGKQTSTKKQFIPQTPSESQGTEPQRDSDDTIVVTGSHIRGIDKPIGGNFITIDREEIDRAGFSSVRDISQTLPQNFGGGPTGELQTGTDSRANTAQGTTFNLRGLGNVATLVLINGRRIPSTGFNGTMADVSVIPLAVIQRVEVLPDGASAVYGSDAVAGVVNIILKKDFSETETRARYGTVTDGNLDEYLLSQATGTAWSGGSALLTYEYFDRGRLTAAERRFTASRDMRRFGGADNRPVFTNPGNIIDPHTGSVIYSIPSGQDGRDLSLADLLPPDPERKNSTETRYLDLHPKQRRHSVFFAANQSITQHINLNGELRYTNRKTRNHAGPVLDILEVGPENPYYFDVYGDGRPIHVAYSFENDGGVILTDTTTNSYGAVIGLDVEYANDWLASIFLSFGQDSMRSGSPSVMDYDRLLAALSEADPSRALNPFGDGSHTNSTVLSEIFRPEQLYKIRGKIYQGQITTTGPVAEVFGNTIRAAVGLDLRREKFFSRNLAADTRDVDRLGRDVAALFGEINVPFVTEEAEISGLNRLELSVSVRHERYKDKSYEPTRLEKGAQSTTNPRIGVLWSPFKNVNFKSSYGTSFRAPSLFTLTSPTSVSSTLMEDPTVPSGFSYVLQVTGTDPQLTHETASTWTLGTEFSVPVTGEPRVQVNYYNIAFKDQVLTPRLLFNDPAIQSRIFRNPDIMLVQAMCNLADAEHLEATPQDCTTPGLIQAVADMRTRNFARTNTEGFDISVSASSYFKNVGDISASINANYILKYRQKLSDTAPSISLLNRPLYPVDLRARGALSWRPNDKLNIAGFVNYTDRYYDDQNNRRVSSWTTIDLTLTYNFGDESERSILRGLALQISANNVFDNHPPFQQNPLGFGYDPTNAEAIGRFIALTATKNW